ncbi:hypothetical protein GQ466_11320 [Actinomadura rayongensis]|uniref:Uncharacterized protein n=1 Tax=Actinomadura rayongensis TaxID=1429076 RepID=A0A6I4W576_9ACTN|nr:hypothetical protein [Actinomadura rayongensis]MXQ64628.1 hypothetical protein [Actinomadura rayongensis]
MPRGIYVHADGELTERFQCAPGPGGWRYVGERSDGVRTDLVVDARWRQIRVEVRAPGGWLRGGYTGQAMTWVRGTDGDASEFTARAAGFLGESPGFLVAVARSLALADGAATGLRVVTIAGPALAALTVARRVLRAGTEVHVTDVAPLPVERYEITDPDTAETGIVHLAGDVVLDAPGIELAELESPPNLVRA